MSDYTVLRAADAPDFTGDAPGAFLGYGRPMGAQQVAFNVRVLEPGTANVPPGYDPSLGHSHTEVEEIYFVIDGEIVVKAGEDVLTLGPRDAILLPAGTPRAVRNESDAEAAFAMVSVKMADPVAGSAFHEGFWP
ncbi:Cupin domain-containing protein [Solirubrobacter pauli]|uniref:Cupin domain-containing protein n=1 Tax=Solirubrobacter pauli TaxID=166793 RepID=A0A660LF71_9ACTN|nr:cupin domain-containing protein [Solirubrobacter pauli]RKQ92570.1 Cupin domain-containing protein [Solirubrobacter pauli]